MLKFMLQMEQDNSKFYLKMFKPWELVLNTIIYLMGAGLVVYFGKEIDWGLLFKGLGLVTVIQIAGSSLSSVYAQMESGYTFRKEFDLLKPDDPRNLGRIRMTNGLLVTISSLGMVTIFIIDLTRNDLINSTGYLFIGIAIILLLIYSIPPFRAIRRGYGEVILAIEGAYLFPTISYLLQTDEIHRILIFIAIPLSLLYLSMEMTRSLNEYSNKPLEKKSGSMISYLGPQNGLQVINLMILAAYLVVGVEGLLGLSSLIVWRFLLTLPVGFFLIWQISQLREGRKPNWQLLELTSIFMVGLTAYFVAMGLWLG